MNVPALPKSAPVEDVIAAIAANINDKPVHEQTAVHYVIRCLASLGNTKSPNTYQGAIEGSKVRIYKWTGTPVGDVVLVTGPSFMPKFVSAAALTRNAGPGDIYTLASPDTSRKSAHAVEYSHQVAAREETRAAAAVAREAAAAASPPPAPRAAAAPRAPRPPRPPRDHAGGGEFPAPSAPPAPPRLAVAPAPAATSAEAGERQELTSFLSSLLG